MKNHKYSFKKKERIKSNKEISRIFNNGIFLFTKNISLVFIKSENADLQINQIAVSVPKKKFKSAVHRNKIKRQFSQYILEGGYPELSELIEEQRWEKLKFIIQTMKAF